MVKVHSVLNVNSVNCGDSVLIINVSFVPLKTVVTGSVPLRPPPAPVLLLPEDGVEVRLPVEEVPKVPAQPALPPQPEDEVGVPTDLSLRTERVVPTLVLRSTT